MWKKFKAKGVQVLALAIQEGVPDPKVNIKKFRKEHGVTYPTLSDEQGAIIQKFGFDGIPSNVILDKTGKYVSHPDEVDDIVKQLKKMTQ